MTEPGGVAKREELSRKRRIGARVLTVIAVLLALVGMLAFFVAHTALDAAGFRAISQRMIEDPAIRTQVSNTAVDALYTNVDVEAAIAERLPPAQKGLAPVLAGLARSGAYRAAEAALERPRVQRAWIELTTSTQRQLVRLLDDRTKFVRTDGGKVVLDLRPIIIQLGNQVVVIGKVADRLPASAGRITVIDESQLETAQSITKILRTVANWMWLLALAVAALAIWLAPDRRRIELRALAVGVLVVGLLMLVVRRVTGNYIVDHVVKDDGAKPAVRNAWSILSQTLADRAWAWITLGLVTLVGVWFVGNTRRAIQARRAARPVLASRWTTYGVALVLLLVIGLIAPPIARGWATALVLLVLIVAGVEIVRTIVLREAPPQSSEQLTGT